MSLEKPEILVSIDGEFTGRIPGRNSMVSLGAVGYWQEGREISRFKINIAELPRARRDFETMNWWSKFPHAWELTKIDVYNPDIAMIEFSYWLETLPGTPKLMGWPLPVDFMFFYWYYVYFLGKSPPFGFDGLDIKTYAMAKMGYKTISEVSFEEVQKRLGIKGREFTHDPVDDALQQAQVFFALSELPKTSLKESLS